MNKVNKAFIFDVDGVLIDCEPAWRKFEEDYFSAQFGKEIYKKIGLTVGLSMQQVYKKAILSGAQIEEKQFEEGFFKTAPHIYATSPIPKGIDALGKMLLQHGFLLAVVSQSPKEWIDILVNRLTFKENIKRAISLNGRHDLRQKPSPDGYIETMKILDSTPKTTIILEDSNSGIAAAKAARAYVIGFQGNLIPGYKQTGADEYANTMDNVIKIVERWQARSPSRRISFAP